MNNMENIVQKLYLRYYQVQMCDNQIGPDISGVFSYARFFIIRCTERIYKNVIAIDKNGITMLR